jgi:hypothetical protein
VHDKLKEAAEVLGAAVEGLVVRYNGLLFELDWNAAGTGKWVVTRTDATDDGEAVLMAEDGDTIEEALAACYVKAEHVARTGEDPDADPF